jgi:membrane protease YdiL (CAAX protease family)
MQLVAVLILFLMLLALEWLFWLSPLAPRLERLTGALGDWYYLLPYHYLLRLAALAGVIWALHPALWPAFAGGANWLYSAMWGLLLAAVTWTLGLAMGQTDRATFARKASAWRREGGWRFWVHAAYLVICPGFVEELLFRWFFLAALWPVAGWWAALLAPLLNLGWHLPVWVDYATHGQQTRRAAAVLAMAVPAAIFALLLTFLSALTHNLLGPALAHGFGDWVGGVTRYTPKKPA